MNVLITGGGGFLGQKLARALAARGELRGKPIRTVALADLAPPTVADAPFPVHALAADIVEPAQVNALAETEPDVIFHLAAVVSAEAEDDFDLGMRVNLQGMVNLLETARAMAGRPVVVFASSAAVFGGPPEEPVRDDLAPTPETSYGTQKAAGELLLADYTRRGFLDGRGLRLPSVSIRPGQPNRAASAFMSSIFREPLEGREAVCPVDADFTHCFLSPRRAVENLIRMAELEPDALGAARTVMSPGRTHRIGDMVEAMRRVAGDETAARIRWEPDERIGRIVGTWRGRFEPRRAEALGLVTDDSFEDNLRFYLEDDAEARA